MIEAPDVERECVGHKHEAKKYKSDTVSESLAQADAQAEHVAQCAKEDQEQKVDAEYLKNCAHFFFALSKCEPLCFFILLENDQRFTSIEITDSNKSSHVWSSKES